jgi:hypothetical protein
MAGSGAGRAMIAPLALLNFCMFMIVCGIAGWAINRLIDGSLGMSIRKKNGQINEKRNTYFSFHLFVLWLED